MEKNDIDEYMNTGKTLHTKNKKKRMLEAGKNPVILSEKEFNDFINNVIEGKAAGEVRAFGMVGKRLANAIYEQRKSLNLERNFLEINADNLREAYKRHAKPKEIGDIPLTKDDFENIPKYLDEFDGITSINDYHGKTEIHIYKKDIKGYIRIITVTSSERGSLQITKLIGVSKEKFEKKYAKKIERDTGSPRSQTESSDDTKPTIGSRLTAGALSDNSITEKSKNVNANDQNSDVNERKSKIPEKNGVTFADIDEIYLIKRRLG